MADGPHEAPKPWLPLVIDKQNKCPLVVWAKAGKGDVVFNSLQILQSLGRANKKEVAEVLHNFLFWRGPRAVDAQDKLSTTWANQKRRVEMTPGGILLILNDIIKKQPPLT